jgi:hypothetical protein
MRHTLLCHCRLDPQSPDDSALNHEIASAGKARNDRVRARTLILNPVYFILCIFLLLGCSNDEVDYGLGEYRVDWVEVKSPRVFSLLNERETMLYNTEENVINNLKTGDRVILNYAYSGKPASGYDYGIKINGISPVICGELKTLPEQDMNKLKNDPVIFESVWIGRKYLNISLYLDINSKQHNIGLVKSNAPHPDYPNAKYLLFRHDKNDDSAGSRKKVCASFDIGSLGQISPSDTIVLSIHPSNYRDSLIVVSKY